jgi:uncharacterized protein (DUF1330 family)
VLLGLHGQYRLVDYIAIEESALSRLRSADPSQPVTLLNLLRFRAQALAGFGVDGLTGMEAFEEYGRLNAAEGVEHAGAVLWMGRGAATVIGSESWDLGVLVRYPTRQHFLDKMDDPKYRAIVGIRNAALADSRLLEFT